jgi:hypothetical protein
VVIAVLSLILGTVNNLDVQQEGTG